MEVKRLLLPLKGKQVDRETLKLAARLAGSGGSSIVALYVIEVPQEYPVDAELPQETRRGEEVLRTVEEVLGRERCSVTAEILQARSVGPAVIREAIERGVDLVLVGMPYKRRHGTFSMGGTVPYILENAPCRVLVLREVMPEAVEAGNGAHTAEASREGQR